MARTTQKANKSPVSKWSKKKSSPKPKVVSTSNGKKKKPEIKVNSYVLPDLLQRDEEKRQRMIAVHAKYQEEYEKGMTLEQRAFNWIFDLWEDHDGPANIEGSEVDYSPEYGCVAEFQDDEHRAECKPFATMEELKRAVEYCVENDVIYHTHDENWCVCEWGDIDSMQAFMLKHMDDKQLREFCVDQEGFGIAEDIAAEKGWEDLYDEDEDEEGKHQSLDLFENVMYSYLEAMVESNKASGAKKVFFQFPKADHEEEYAEALRRFEAGEYKKKKKAKSNRKVEDDEEYSMSDDSDEESSSDEDEDEEDEEGEF